MNISAFSYKYLITTLVTLIIILVTSQSSTGKTYYFSNSIGDDTHSSTQAQNPTTPWKSITKLNSFFSSLVAGDSVLFRRGDSFYGSIKVSKSGTSLLPIIIGAYGSGVKPVITGLTNLTSWVSLGNGIYRSAATSCKPSLNMVTLNGIQKAIGRYPNTGYLSIDSHSGTTSITDSQLAGTPNWTGAEVVIRKNRWIIDRNTITSHSGGTITYISASTYPGVDGNGYFIQKDAKTLDQLGEWFFDPTQKNLLMYFGSNNPGSYTVKVSSIDTLLYIRSYNYLRFINLRFEGANKTAVKLTTSNYLVFENCEIDFSGYDGVNVSGGSSYITLNSCEIDHTNNVAINLGTSSSTTNTLSNSHISNTGIIPGMGGNGDGSYIAVIANSSNGLLQYNRIDSSGYIGIQFDGNNTKVKHNFINHFCFIKEDGGGIYTWRGDYTNAQYGQEIANNIVINGTGAPEGVLSTLRLAHGIMLDGSTQNISVTNNSVAQCVSGGILLNRQVRNLIIMNNTFYDNKYQLWSQRQVGETANLKIEKNVFFAKTSSQRIMYIDGILPSEFGSVDYNYLCRPILEDKSLYVAASPSYLQLNLSEWKAAFRKDLNSKGSPRTITTTNDLYFDYNPTKVNKTIPLPDQYIGVDGTVYNNSITLLPYASVVLIKSLNSINQPPFIQNQTFQTSKNSSNGTAIGTVIANDPNTGQTLTFSIASGNTNGAFAINSATGALTIANSSALTLQTSNIFYLIVKVVDNGTSNLSSQATITVNLISTITGCSATGSITYQVWNNIGASTAVSSLTNNVNYPNNPTTSTLIMAMEGKTNLADNYGARIAGYICAPATGSYTFWIAGNNNCELWLSTDDKATNKRRIAYHTDFTTSREWNKYVTQKSSVINLSQGQRYYIEALVKENNYEDNLAVGWIKPGQTGTVPAEVIPGSVLSPIETNQTILVSSVSLPVSSAVIVGSTIQLSATLLPANASNSSLKWTSSNLSIATVSGSGVVTGISVGAVTITAISTDGSNKTGNCSFTVNFPPCTASGSITYEVWNNIGTSITVSSLTSNVNYPNNPTSSTLITSMEGKTNLADNYGARIAGYICAPATGSYTFWIAGNNNCELWLSTDDQAANKQKIAFHTDFTGYREWNKFVTQKSSIINLSQGQRYYVEALVKENNYEDNLAVGWIKPGQTGTVPAEVIPGSVLSPITTKSIEVKPENIAAIDMNIKLSVYPNPLSKNDLNISIENLTSEAILKIFSITGIEIYSERILNSGTLQIDRNLFNSGIYIIKISNDQFLKTSKLIVK